MFFNTETQRLRDTESPKAHIKDLCVFVPLCLCAKTITND